MENYMCCDAIRNTSKARQRIAQKNGMWALNHPNWTHSDIWDAYARPSYEKVKAWKYCQRLCEKMDGWNLRIASKNIFQFSAVFEFVDDVTGVLSVAYITRDYDSFAEQTA